MARKKKRRRGRLADAELLLWQLGDHYWQSQLCGDPCLATHWRHERARDPRPGDLVIEMTNWRAHCVGWLEERPEASRYFIETLRGEHVDFTNAHCIALPAIREPGRIVLLGEPTVNDFQQPRMYRYPSGRETVHMADGSEK